MSDYKFADRQTGVIAGKPSSLMHFWRTATVGFGFWIVAIASITALRLITAVSFGSSSPSYAGDETTYVGLVQAMESRETFIQWGSGFSLQLYPASRSFIWPAHLLHSTGIDAFFALRITSILYACALSILAAYIVYFVQSGNRFRPLYRLPLRSRYSLALALMLLWPSLNAWFVVGLKESTSMFWILLSLFSVVIALGPYPWMAKSGALVALVVGITATYQVRDYLGTVIVVTTGLMALATLPRNFRHPQRTMVVAMAAFLAIATGAALGMHMAQPISIGQSEARSVPSLDGFRPLEPDGDITPPKLRPYTQLGEQLLQAPLSASDARERLAIDAQSAVPNECTGTPSYTERIPCEIERLPVALVRVAVLPLIGLDRTDSSTSLSARFASIENVAWLVMFIWVGAMLVIYRSTNRLLTFGIATYTAFILLGLAVFGGNLGTIFRHKAQVLPMLLLLIAISSRQLRWPVRMSK